jgi:ribosomal protein L39E
MLLRIDPKNKLVSRILGKRLSSFDLSERDVQGIFFDQLDRLLPDDELILLMQSRHWREEPDLLAVDAKGSLYIFEIKIWESSTENILQALRYGQIFGSYRYEDIDLLYRKFHKADRNLLAAVEAKFEIQLAKEDFNSKQVFVIITNGLDVKTREAMRYWRKTGLDVRPWVYRIYSDNHQHMLMELNPFRVEDDPYEDVMQGYYIVNTNIANDPIDDRYMIENKRAAAFFSPWKRKIERLSKGDIVFLYRSGAGIVAVGKANGKLEKRDYQGDPTHKDEEYSMGLINFHEIVPPLTASEIKEITGINHCFMQTMFGMDTESGQKLYAGLKKLMTTPS